MDWKKIGKNFIYPHLAVLILLLPISIAFLIFSLVYFDSSSIIGIISYLLAFYVLVVLCFRIPRIIKFFKKVKCENKYIKRYFEDVNLRMNISLYGSLVWNGAFAIFQLWLGFYLGSIWFYSMFAYYILLAIMRFFLLKHTRNYKPNEETKLELKRYTLCGWILLFMNIALSVIIFFIVYLNKTFYYHEITTITLATYTFVTFTFAIINMIRYKKYNSPVYSASKAISMISATVSMLTLETAMLTTFGGENVGLFRQIILSASGLAVSIFAIIVAVNIIVKGTRKIKEIKS